MGQLLPPPKFNNNTLYFYSILSVHHISDTLWRINNNPKCSANVHIPLQMGKLRQSQVEWLGEGHAERWNSWQQKLGLLSYCLKHRSLFLCHTIWPENSKERWDEGHVWRQLVTQERYLQTKCAIKKVLKKGLVLVPRKHGRTDHQSPPQH